MKDKIVMCIEFYTFSEGDKFPELPLLTQIMGTVWKDPRKLISSDPDVIFRAKRMERGKKILEGGADA